MLNTERVHFPIDVILVCTRWYAAYAWRYRHLEEMMQERGVDVDYSSINRWAVLFLPLLEKAALKEAAAQHTVCTGHDTKTASCHNNHKIDDAKASSKSPMSCCDTASKKTTAACRCTAK